MEAQKGIAAEELKAEEAALKAEEEDLNVSNLLATKSQRAPATQSPPPAKKDFRGVRVIKAAAVGAAGTLGMALILMIGRRWFRSRRHSANGVE